MSDPIPTSEGTRTRFGEGVTDARTWFRQQGGLSDDDAEIALRSAYANRGALHYCVGSDQQCIGQQLCGMCLNAARLTVQTVAPLIRDRFVERIHYLTGWRCHHPLGDD